MRMPMAQLRYGMAGALAFGQVQRHRETCQDVRETHLDAGVVCACGIGAKG